MRFVKEWLMGVENKLLIFWSQKLILKTFFKLSRDISKYSFFEEKTRGYSFQRPRGSFGHLFIQLVSRVTKTNQDSPRSKMGRSFRIWSPFCHPTKTELKCAFFSFFRKNQIFLKKGAFKAKITARDMVWLCYELYHCEV